MHIPFNKPYLTGKETFYIQQAVASGKISGDGIFTKKCHQFFEEKYAFKKALLTTSCTDALEMAALLIDIKEGDEIILPSFTFVSTANAFVLRGAKLVFADSRQDHPGLDMDVIMALAAKHNIFVIEDAAQAIDSFYKGRPLGSIGHLAAFSFHETKNIISGEGGMLVINDSRFAERAEIIREKGTNRSKFFRGEVDKYNWVDIGSSFLPSDIIAAFLYAQLENIELIQNKRKLLWKTYFDELSAISDQIQLPSIPDFATNNAHMFYIVCKDENQRNALILHLKNENVHSVFHYLSLHKSPFYAEKHGDRVLPLSDFYTNGLIRLPLFFELETSQVESIICKSILSFFDN